MGGASARWRSRGQAVGAADHRRKLARGSNRVPLGPHITTPAGIGYAAGWGAARPLPQRREILHQADIAGPFGMEGRSDRVSLRWGIHARRHEVPGMVRRLAR